MKTVQVIYNGDPVSVVLSEFNNSIVFESTRKHGEGEIEAYVSARDPKPGFNQSWILAEFVPILVEAKIVEATGETIDTNESEEGMAILCNIVHPLYNDGGFSSFGDFCRTRLRQQCQYGSRYIDGRLEGYPNLGEGLRFNNGRGYSGQIRDLDTGDYHSIRIHRDDMDEFERRYKAYQDGGSR
jgi:hypothetical protein